MWKVRKEEGVVREVRWEEGVMREVRWELFRKVHINPSQHLLEQCRVVPSGAESCDRRKEPCTH